MDLWQGLGKRGNQDTAVSRPARDANALGNTHVLNPCRVTDGPVCVVLGAWSMGRSPGGAASPTPLQPPGMSYRIAMGLIGTPIPPLKSRGPRTKRNS